MYLFILRCIIQATLTQFASMSSFIWSAVIAYLMYVSVIGSGKSITLVNHQLMLFTIGWVFPLLCSLIPIQFNAYNPVPQTCSITQNSNGTPSFNTILILNSALFYCPLMISITFSTVLVTKTILYINRQREDMALNFQLQIQHTFSNNLSLYPIILTLCWLPSTIVYFYALATKSRPDFGPIIENIQYTMSFLQGFLNCCAFFFNYYKIRKLLSLRTTLAYRQGTENEVQKYNSSGSVDILLDT